MSVSLREIEEVVKRLQPEDNCLRKTVRSSDLKIVLSLIGKCGGISESDLKGLIITKLRATQGYTFTQIAEELTQAILATPTFSGGEKPTAIYNHKEKLFLANGLNDIKKLNPTEQKEYCSCKELKTVGIDWKNCFNCGKPIPAEKKEEKVYTQHEMNEACRIRDLQIMELINKEPEPKPKDRIEELVGTYGQSTYPEEKMWNKINELVRGYEKLIRHINKES